MERERLSLPMVALRGMAVLPEMVTHFDVSREKSIQAIERAMEGDQLLFLAAQKDVEVEDPGIADVYEMGCVVSIKQMLRLPKKITRVLVSGQLRARIEELEQETPFLYASVEVVPDELDSLEEGDAQETSINREAMLRGLKDLFREYMLKNPKTAKELGAQIDETQDLRKLVDLIGANLPLRCEEQQELLEEPDVRKRFELLSYKVVQEIRVQNIKDELQTKIKERVDKNQREYILREELKLIREELGDETTLSDADEFQQAADALKAPAEVKEKISKEIKRFRNSMNSPAEAGVIRTYIETMLELPWDKTCRDNKDIAYAKQVLDEDHYGLEKVKERVLEFLAVRALTRKGDVPILCLVGPPGTGKTSIAKSLARALKKPYVRISLGGVRDEAEIRGHRKTYVGAMPGRIAEAIRRAKVKNPLMLLDEIDKVSNDYKGDTFSALLEVLDSEQNMKFRDHYLEVPLDLSEVLFVTTANTLQTIPRPLLDRMEVIEVSSYTETPAPQAESAQRPEGGSAYRQQESPVEDGPELYQGGGRAAAGAQDRRDLPQGGQRDLRGKETGGTYYRAEPSPVSGKGALYLSDGQRDPGSGDRAGAGLDQRRRGYPSDRSQHHAWRRRDPAHRSAGRCDEGICPHRDQLYPLSQPGAWH